MLNNLAILPSIQANQAYFLMFGEIDHIIAQNFAEWILSCNTAPPEERPNVLTVFVNSVGGSLSDGWAIIDFMKGSTIPVVTVGVGNLASCGLLIFMGGEKGYRLLTEHTSIMSHQFSGGFEGKQHELLSIVREYDNTQKRLLHYMSDNSGMTEEEVERKLMPASDVWLTAEEAVALGIADRVASLK